MAMTIEQYKQRQAQVREIKKSSTWLQGVGCHLGKPAGQLQVGDVTVWNFATTATVTELISETAKFLTIGIEEKGKSYTRRLKKDRIVAIQGMGVVNLTQDDLKYA